MLVNAKDNRLDTPAPVTIVRDKGEKAGSPQIVNGLSCIVCHNRGMISFTDAIRAHPAVFGDPREKILRIFPEKARMDQVLQSDRETVLKALERATGPFLKVADDKDREIGEFAEPLSEVVRVYFKDLTVQSAAAEFGFKTSAEFRAKVEQDPDLTELGLGPLLNDGGLKRELWQLTRPITSGVALNAGPARRSLTISPGRSRLQTFPIIEDRG